MKWRSVKPGKTVPIITAILLILGLQAVQATAAQAAPSPNPHAPAGASASTAFSLANPDKQLPAGWRSARDRAVTTVSDTDGLSVLVADETSAYRWRTAAVLAEPGFDVDEWIWAVLASLGLGDRAVVVYAPRTFTNSDVASNGGAFVAVVDLSSGSVRKLALRASLAYYNPGCGAGETVAISTFTSGARPTTTVTLVDAATGAVTATITDPGQVTSAVPVAGGVVAADGDRLVALRSGAAAKTLRTESGVPLRLHADGHGGVGYEVAAGGSVQVRRWAGGTRPCSARRKPVTCSLPLPRAGCS